MKKKAIAGTLVMALALTTGLAANAAPNTDDKLQKESAAYECTVSMSGESALSMTEVDVNSLPDDANAKEIAAESSEAAVLTEALSLPDGVEYKDAIDMSGEIAQTLPQE